MKVYFVIHGIGTGIIDPGCGQCGVLHVSGMEAYRRYPLPPGHAKYLLRDRAELRRAHLFDPDLNRYSYRIERPRGLGARLVKV